MSWRSTGNHRSSGAGAGRQEVLCRRRLLVKALPLALVLFYFVLSFRHEPAPVVNLKAQEQKQQILVNQTMNADEIISNSTHKHKEDKLIHHKDQDYPLYPTSPLKGYPKLQAERPACEAALERGFWQRMQPVPFEKWKYLHNLTCDHSTSTLQDWQKRVPSTVILGTQKGGTTALAYYLYNHPSVVYLPLKELHVFDEDLDAVVHTSNQLNQTALLHYYQHDVIGSMVNLSQYRVDPNKQALDATPNYLFASDRAFARLLCAAPWVKLIVLLRNPIDRAFSQYHMQYHRDLRHPEYRKHKTVLSFDEYVDLDLQVLHELGITNSTTTSSDGAWSEYTKWGLNAPVGRGLYWIQLQQLLEVMTKYDKPKSDLLILQSERYRKLPNETYQQVLEFLNLPHFELPQYGTDIHKTEYATFKMKESTQAKLQQFYAPHNAKLAQLLGEEWRDVWK